MRQTLFCIYLYIYDYFKFFKVFLIGFICHIGRNDVVQLLLDKGVDIREKDNFYNDAMYYAVKIGMYCIENPINRSTI